MRDEQSMFGLNHNDTLYKNETFEDFDDIHSILAHRSVYMV